VNESVVETAKDYSISHDEPPRSICIRSTPHSRGEDVSNTENQTIVRLGTEVGDSVLLGLPDFGSLCRWTGRKDQFRPGCMLRHRCERLTILIVFLSSKKKSVKKEKTCWRLLRTDVVFPSRYQLEPKARDPTARSRGDEKRKRKWKRRVGMISQARVPSRSALRLCSN